MKFADTKTLKTLLDVNLDTPTKTWIQEKLNEILETDSAKGLYMAYSLLGTKLNDGKKLDISILGDKEISDYLTVHQATILQVARIYLLSSVLKKNSAFFQPKVANLIQIADTEELKTFLKFLILLPHPENYKQAAVEALRTNIATVFDAISADNPYPAEYFDDQQWNQMYLKAAFMQQDLSRILEIGTRANADLARIISDYAHERWAASRDVDPYFWRPVGSFLDEGLLKDMDRLLHSDNLAEKRAGALCCFQSDSPEAEALLNHYPDLRKEIADGKLTWSNLKK